jgi:hypothetical protein
VKQPQLLTPLALKPTDSGLVQGAAA